MVFVIVASASSMVNLQLRSNVVLGSGREATVSVILELVLGEDIVLPEGREVLLQREEMPVLCVSVYIGWLTDLIFVLFTDL